MKAPAFPKIFSIGSKQTERLFQGEVEVTEKIDGSQICFGKVDGELFIRSKGAELFVDNPEKMFATAIIEIKERFDYNMLPEGMIIYGEYLKSEKHNVLKYNRVPKNNIMIYGVMTRLGEFTSDHAGLQLIADKTGFEVVPLLFQGKINSIEELKANLDRESVLGGAKIEGFVVKNYNEQLLIGGQVIPILMGKYVSEAFKEIHGNNWKACNTSKGKWDTYKEQFKSEARYDKAIQYLRDIGQLTQTPKDIGALIKRVQQDIREECGDDIKDFLFREFGEELLRQAVKDLPLYYKEKLLNEQKIGG